MIKQKNPQLLVTEGHKDINHLLFRQHQGDLLN